MKFARFFLVATFISVSASSVSWGQTADNEAIAEALFQEAQRLMNEGRVSEACVKFVESDRVDPGLGTQLSIADCYEREGKLAAAWAKFTEIIAAAQQAKRKDREEFAKSRAEALAARVPKLVIVMDGADPKTVTVLRDGLTMGAATFGLPLPIDPGDHVIIARSPGFKEWSKTVTIEESKTVEVKVPALEAEKAEPPAPPGPSPSAPGAITPVAPKIVPEKPIPRGSKMNAQDIGAIALGGTGLVVLAVGSAYGWTAMSKQRESNDGHCNDKNLCNPTGLAKRGEGIEAGETATNLFMAGGVAVGGAIALFATRSRKSDASAHVFLGPTGVWLNGHF